MSENKIWINTNEALELCNKYNLRITRNGLYFVGSREGFKREINKKLNYSNIEFEKNKLLEYIKEAIKPIPKGWISIKDAAELRHITVGHIYHLISEKKIEYKILGRERINHVLIKEISNYGKE